MDHCPLTSRFLLPSDDDPICNRQIFVIFVCYSDKILNAVGPTLSCHGQNLQREADEMPHLLGELFLDMSVVKSGELVNCKDEESLSKAALPVYAQGPSPETS